LSEAYHSKIISTWYLSDPRACYGRVHYYYLRSLKLVVLQL